MQPRHLITNLVHRPNFGSKSICFIFKMQFNYHQNSKFMKGKKTKPINSDSNESINIQVIKKHSEISLIIHIKNETKNKNLHKKSLR